MSDTPQIENGYVRIATELFEELCRTRVNGEAMQVYLFIIRKTYGFQRKSDAISISQFERGTSLARRSVQRAIKRCAEMNLITIRINADRTTAIYSPQKDYSKWCLSAKKRTPDPLSAKKRSVVSAKKRSVVSAKKRSAKDTLKDTSKDKRNVRLCVDDHRMAMLLYNLILEWDPLLKEPNWEKWNLAINRLHRIDKRPYDEIEQVIRWVQNEKCWWRTKIASTEKLRDKYVTVRGQMLSDKTGKKSSNIQNLTDWLHNA